jgi:hypothetical protein
MKVKTLILDNVSFSTDSNSNLNKATLFFNSIGNFLLSPARHLFQGKSAICVLVPTDRRHADPIFGKVDDRHSEGLERVCKTIASIALFIPGTILGAAVKGFTVLASDRLKRRYESLEKMEDALKESCVKAAGDVAICLYQKDSAQLFSILKNLKDNGQLDEFIQYFSGAALNSSGGNYAFLEDYPHLYQTYERNRVVDRSIEHVIGCFLKLYADEKIQISDFFDKMKQLDEYAKTKDYSGIQKDFDSIQRRIDLSSDLSTMTTKVEEYLREKNFF